jgi:hypothetical protein
MLSARSNRIESVASGKSAFRSTAVDIVGCRRFNPCPATSTMRIAPRTRSGDSHNLPYVAQEISIDVIVQMMHTDGWRNVTEIHDGATE